MLELYNTLTRKKEVFKPLHKGVVCMYSCGPTVYNYPHIGNYRAYIAADILRRYLEYSGLKVKQVMNLTDVDDKTIRGSREKKIPLGEYTAPYAKAFFEDLKTLNIEPAFMFPKATEHIDDMVALIRTLMKKGFAYKAGDGSIYFSISKFGDYGKLAGINVKKLKAGARIQADEYDKKHVNDFALWKAWTPEDGNVFWETPAGKGRPGWHIECSVMSMKHLGKTLDIHTGGIDLVFPHHQNEIAQSEAASSRKFVRFWVHNEWLLVDGKKMSKSLGNFYTLRDIIKKGYSAKAIRYALLSTHYRQQINFTFNGLKASENTVRGLADFVRRLESVEKGDENKKISALIKKTEKSFEKAMDDDLNIAAALSSLFGFASKINIFMKKGRISKKDAAAAIGLMKKLDKILGILEKDDESLGKKEEGLISEREEARKKKDYEKADRIREELKKRGVILEDTPRGVIWKKIK